MNEKQLKKILKAIKLNESSISLFLGILVVVIVAVLVTKYISNKKGSLPNELMSGTNSVESQVKTHKVQKGDNLWNIALTYYGDGFKWVDIATENKLANASVIEVGQELTIPNIEQDNNMQDEEVMTNGNENTETTNQMTKAEPNSITASTYEVVHGDNLWNIAVRKYGDGYKWVEIAKKNNLSRPDLIHSGNVLILP